MTKILPGKLYQLTSETNKWILIQEIGKWNIRHVKKSDFVFESYHVKIIQPKTIALSLNQKIFNVLWSEKYNKKIIHTNFLFDNLICRLTTNHITCFLQDWVILNDKA